jgi:hypothetical protein
VAAAALDHADRRLRAAGRREQVNLMRHSLDEPWPKGDFDLVVYSEVGYYLHAETLRSLLDREQSRLNGATVVAAHWRHPVEDYPISGDHTNQDHRSHTRTTPAPQLPRLRRGDRDVHRAGPVCPRADRTCDRRSAHTLGHRRLVSGY